MRPIRFVPLLLLSATLLLASCGASSSSHATGLSSFAESHATGLSSSQQSHDTGLSSPEQSHDTGFSSSEESHDTGLSSSEDSHDTGLSSSWQSHVTSLSSEESSSEQDVVSITGYVNGTSVTLTNIHPDWSDYGVYSLTLLKGDVVTFFFNDEALHFFTWPEGVETDLGDAYVALYDGEYTFGVNQAKKIFFEAPTPPESQGNVMIFVNNVEINPRNIHPDWPDYGVYFIELEKGDKIRFYLDYELVHFYQNDADLGFEYTAIRSGEYLFGVNPAKQVWFTVPDPVITATINDFPVILGDIGSSDESVKAVYRLDLEIGDNVRFYVEDEPMTLYIIDDGQNVSLGEVFIALYSGEYLFTWKTNQKMYVNGPVIEM